MADDQPRYTKMRDQSLTPDGDFGSTFFKIADASMGDANNMTNPMGTTDVDLLKERNGIFLVGETKGIGYNFDGPRWMGQRIVLERLSRLEYGGKNVVECFVAEATPGFETVKRFRVCRAGVWGPWCEEDSRLFLLQYFTLRGLDMAEQKHVMPRRESGW